MGKYKKIIEVIEGKHEKITSQFDTILQDYKKLHSAFELLDIELKKINTQEESELKEIRETKGLVAGLEKNQEEAYQLICELKKKICEVEAKVLASTLDIQEQIALLKESQSTSFEEISKQNESHTKALANIEEEISKQGESHAKALANIEKEMKAENLKQEQRFKKTQIWFGVLSGAIFVVFVLVLVGLFI